jgi:4-hydroxy-tetrahydrodipicolinate synthase
MVLLPFYYNPNVQDAMNHLRAVSKAWGGPIMVYNNPWFAGFELSPEQVKTLSDEGVVNSIKAAHGDPMRCDYIKYLCGDAVTVFYGHDYAPLEAFVVGADGWLSGLPNMIPDLCVELFNAIDLDKDMAKAQKIWKRMQPIAYYFMYVRRGNNDPHWLPVIKEGVSMQGMDVGLPRLPAKEMGEEDKAVLFDYLKQVYPDLKKN